MEVRASNITWHEGHVIRKERERLLLQKGCTIWMTGLSASGKSTLAFTLEHALVQRNRMAYVLDGDSVRHGLVTGDEDNGLRGWRILSLRGEHERLGHGAFCERNAVLEVFHVG